MKILIDKVRIKNFRSLQDVEVDLAPITILVGANNAGKTTFLRALNTVLGVSKTAITKDDLFIDKNGDRRRNGQGEQEPIVIDIRIVPTVRDQDRNLTFNNKWTSLFGNDIKTDSDNNFFALRTELKFKGEGDVYQTTQYVLSDWDSPNPQEHDEFKNGKVFKAISLYFLDAQRDLLDDIKVRNSYFGKLAAQIEDDYNPATITTINEQIEELNKTAIKESKVLKHLQESLSELNRTTQTRGNGVVLNPFSKKIRDLHKGMKVDYQDEHTDAFGLEYHGMGTRSWASILSFSAFTSWETKLREDEHYFPILALEEPEAHLHPNAQRTLYRQLEQISGQKIVSTHSPYIAGQATLAELRHFYKTDDTAKISQLLFSNEDEQKIAELLKEITDSGNTNAINQQNRPIIEQLKTEKRTKLNKEEARKIGREIMNTRGELLFSKVIVLFEGETEEQALPILFNGYFGRHPYELGINFVGVGGKGKYQPFLNLANFLNLPWYILSDGDGTTENDVKTQIDGIFGQNYDTLFVLDNADFEKYLVDNGFQNELTKAINEIKGGNYFPTEYINQQNGKNRKGGTVKEYKDATDTVIAGQQDIALIDCLREGKTTYAEQIAIEICQKKDATGKCILPPKINELFEKIKSKFITSTP